MSQVQHTKANLPEVANKMAQKFGIQPEVFWDTLKSTAFKQRDGSEPTNEQMMALLVVANQYGLNPWTKEIYAFPDKNNGIIPVVGVDGWARIINSHPQFDGLEFRFSEKSIKMPGAKVECPEWIEVSIYRKDRSRPITVREYLDEVYRAPFEGQGRNGTYKVEGPWQTHTKRLLRHKGLIQCARLAFGFTGIYDQDEAERIIEAETIRSQAEQALPPLSEVKSAVQQIGLAVKEEDGRLIAEGPGAFQKAKTLKDLGFQFRDKKWVMAHPEAGKAIETETEPLVEAAHEAEKPNESIEVRKVETDTLKIRDIADLGIFLQELGLDMETKKHGDKIYAIVKGDTEGLESNLESIGFHKGRTGYGLEITNLMTEEAQVF